mmetsp:Transcript_51746/g.150362  ORF Transcript_51746/g.150362 Transcript_51746/m.150362 type:complete len:227 (+) Transcript_51746:590-1270(+)
MSRASSESPELSAATAASNTSSAAECTTCSAASRALPMDERNISSTWSTRSVSRSTTSRVSSCSKRHRTANNSCEMKSASSSFSASKSANNRGTFEVASSGTHSESKAKVPTSIMHSNWTSSSENPTMSNLCNTSNKPPSHSVNQGTSLFELSKAARTPIASTSTSGRLADAPATRTTSCNHESSSPSPARITPRRRRRTGGCAAACRKTFNINGSAPCIPRRAAL